MEGKRKRGGGRGGGGGGGGGGSYIHPHASGHTSARSATPASRAALNGAGFAQPITAAAPPSANARGFGGGRGAGRGGGQHGFSPLAVSSSDNAAGVVADARHAAAAAAARGAAAAAAILASRQNAAAAAPVVNDPSEGAAADLDPAVLEEVGERHCCMHSSRIVWQLAVLDVCLLMLCLSCS